MDGTVCEYQYVNIQVTHGLNDGLKSNELNYFITIPKFVTFVRTYF